MFSKTALGVAAAAAGITLVGYCIYFDHKRRSDPLFKQKLRERRRKTKQNAGSGGGGSSTTPMPNLRDAESVQKFFLQEVQLGEELLAGGDIDSGVEHLSNAVAVCGQPQQLLQVLQQTLPPQVFQLLLQRLPAASQRVAASAVGGDSGTPGSIGMHEDDLE